MAGSWLTDSAVVRLDRRDREGHKGTYGRVLVVGGSPGMVGAVGLAVNAALRGGCGLAQFAAPRCCQSVIAPICPCATSVALECGPDGAPTGPAVEQLASAAERIDVLAVGPGMAVGDGQAELVRWALSQADKPVVLDADGLNNLVGLDGWPGWRRAPLVLTPHPGEFSRLTGKGIGEIQSDRSGALVEAMTGWLSAGDGAGPLVCVLKGAGTLVAFGEPGAPDGRLYTNTTGNPGMATGGAGDVLTGLVAALIGQGLSPYDAARLGVYAHGLAGDLAAEALGETSVIATDLIDHLPEALRRLT